MGLNAQVKVAGLRPFQDAVDTVAAQAGAVLENSVVDALSGTVARTRQLIPSLTGAAKASVRLAPGPRGATVTAGGSKAPYLGWLDYGGKTGIGGSVRRPFIKEGRYLWPAFRKEYDGLIDAAATDLFRLIERQGLEVKESG